MEYKEIGRYGMLRHHYLEEHQPILFWQLLLEGTLESHLVQVDAEAHEAVNSCIRRMAEAQGMSDGVKQRNPLEWAARMNAIKAAAEEAILPKFLYPEENG